MGVDGLIKQEATLAQLVTKTASPARLSDLVLVNLALSSLCLPLQKMEVSLVCIVTHSVGWLYLS